MGSRVAPTEREREAIRRRLSVQRELSARAVIRQHKLPCDGMRCPCYVQGQNDLVMAINTLRRLGMPLDAILAEVSNA